jgi:hypothetical protein
VLDRSLGMTIVSQLRANARRYRELAQRYAGNTAEGMREAAAQLDRQADALEAYQAAARLTAPHVVTVSA